MKMTVEGVSWLAGVEQWWLSSVAVSMRQRAKSCALVVSLGFLLVEEVLCFLCTL